MAGSVREESREQLTRLRAKEAVWGGLGLIPLVGCRSGPEQCRFGGRRVVRGWKGSEQRSSVFSERILHR